MQVKLKMCLLFWDANRYNENNLKNPRFTFGEYLMDGSKGSIQLYSDGKRTVQKLVEGEKEHKYVHNDVWVAGDCFCVFQRDFIDNLNFGEVFETSGENYFKTLLVQDTVYESAKIGSPVLI